MMVQFCHPLDWEDTLDDLSESKLNHPIPTGCLKRNWVLPNWALGDPAANWEEILLIFVANLQMLNSVKLSFFRHPVWWSISLIMLLFIPPSKGPQQLKLILKLEYAELLPCTMYTSPPQNAIMSLSLSPSLYREIDLSWANKHTIMTICTLGCFINNTLQKKKMQYQYAPLTGVYKPDMKEFFS